VAVLVTRPQPGAAETAVRLLALGRQPLVAPMLDIIPLAPRLPPQPQLQAVLVTSANALPALAHHTGLPLLTVGDATAAQARARGFLTVHSAAGDAAALAVLAARVCDPARGPLLLAGQQGRGEGLAAALRGAGFTVHHAAVYAAHPATKLPGGVRAAFLAHRIEAALFFSAATAQVFVALAATLSWEALADVPALAMSPATAAALAPLPWRGVRTAAHPTQGELLGLLP
jgi:uroporphyrinogen-III synthase